MTRVEDVRLKGRPPEFARMSLRPGIGAESMEDVVRVLLAYSISDKVPAALRHGSAILPLGRYLREKLRAYLGIEKDYVDLERWRDELRNLREIATVREVTATGRQIERVDERVFAALLVEQDAEKVRQLEVRRKLYERKGKGNEAL